MEIMAGTTALPAGGNDRAADASQSIKDGWKNVDIVLGDDMGKFLRSSRTRGRHKVVASSEGGPASRSQVKRISDLLRDSTE